MVRFNVSLIHHGKSLTRVCAAFFSWGPTSSHNAIKHYFPHKLSYAFCTHAQPCACTHTHIWTHLMKMLASRPHAHKETAPNTREKQGGEATHASSFIMTEAECKAVEHYSSLQEEKELIGKKRGRVQIK